MNTQKISHVTSLAAATTTNETTIDNKSTTTISTTAQQQLGDKGGHHRERVPPTNNSSNVITTKNHKVEGKNKKSLHQKQQQQQQANNGNQKQAPNIHQQQNLTQKHLSNKTTSPGGRKANQKNLNGTNKSPTTLASSSETTSSNCSTLDQFALRAQELKAEICAALEKQASHHQTIDQPVEVVKLKNEILKLSGVPQPNDKDHAEAVDQQKIITKPPDTVDDGGEKLESREDKSKSGVVKAIEVESGSNSTTPQMNQVEDNGINVDRTDSHLTKLKESKPSEVYVSDTVLRESLDKLTLIDQSGPNKPTEKRALRATGKAKPKGEKSVQSKSSDVIAESFEPLNARLDSNSKLVALISSLQNHFKDAPQLLEPVCRKLVDMSDQNDQLLLECEKLHTENQRVSLVKQKLENLCRELQKSNNAIRIESLELIKVEQGKAKEQTTKIQSTLSGVIKLFDENQQRNMSLRQENQELQTKLKSLLDHCDNWEKSVEASLRQRDIENRLIKTELAKSNLLKNEEKEKFLSEKQELLQLLSMMQEQQHRIEGQEAKLRSDLSSYASKYDQCQAVISQGMDKFHTESQRMLKQIEVSRSDYKALLSKYESSNRKMVKLLEEKQSWARSMNLAKKKNETLEKLCRALRERKSESVNEMSSTTSESGQSVKTTPNNNIIDINQSSEVDLDKENNSSSLVKSSEYNNSDKILTSESGSNTDITSDDESKQNELSEQKKSTHVA